MSRTEIDRSTLLRAQRGDPNAFRMLYDCYADAVHGFLARMIGEDAEDALQETFLRVHRAVARFSPDGPAAVSTWIFAIARRVALTRIDTSRRRPIPSSETTVAPGDPELRRALQRAIGELPTPQRTVFVLRECCQLAYEEIAVIEQIDLGTVKSRLHRARAALQARLADVLSPPGVRKRRGGQR